MLESPCIGICQLRADGLCKGCLRTIDEIAGWTNMSDDQQKEIYDRCISNMFDMQHPEIKD